MRQRECGGLDADKSGVGLLLAVLYLGTGHRALSLYVAVRRLNRPPLDVGGGRCRHSERELRA